MESKSMSGKLSRATRSFLQIQEESEKNGVNDKRCENKPSISFSTSRSLLSQVFLKIKGFPFHIILTDLPYPPSEWSLPSKLNGLISIGLMGVRCVSIPLYIFWVP